MTIPNPDDPRAEKCGHNFPPAECPYEHCGYRKALKRLEKCEAAAAPIAKLTGVMEGYDDEFPLRRIILPFTWPTVGDIKRLRAALEK